MKKILNKTFSEFFTVLMVLTLLLPIVKAEELIMDPLDELLPPVISDPGHDPTYPLQEPDWYYGNSWRVTLNETEFVEGKAIQFYKRFRYYSDLSAEFYVYRFTNTSSAEGYYNKEIDHIKSVDDYAEVPISGGFGVKYDYQTQQIGISWGLVKNIVFSVKIYTINIVEDPTDQLIDFTKLQQAQITDAHTIPEFSKSTSLLVMIIIVSTLAVCYKRGVTSKKCLKNPPNK
jgi:hypothetical protein